MFTSGISYKQYKYYVHINVSFFYDYYRDVPIKKMYYCKCLIIMFTSGISI